MSENSIIEIQNKNFDRKLNKALSDDKMEDFLLMNYPYNGIIIYDEEGKYNKYFSEMLRTLYRFSNNNSNIQVNRIFEKALENIIKERLNNPEVVSEILEILYYQLLYEKRKVSPYYIDSINILKLLNTELIKRKNDYEKIMKKQENYGIEKEVNMWQIIEEKCKDITENVGKKIL